jgi:hypothetical protein
VTVTAVPEPEVYVVCGGCGVCVVVRGVVARAGTETGQSGVWRARGEDRAPPETHNKTK